jgi:ABC-2 type transport system ATP-binding protein
MPGDEYAVVTTGLSKRFGRDAALEQVDLRVPDGAVFVLVGGNGAGKSTLFKLLMNLERPDSGTAQVFGVDVAEYGPEVRAQIGYVPERHDAPYGAMSCERLLGHVATFYPAWDDVYARHLVRSLGVRLDRRVGGLSKGETRRLQLVLALAHRPRLLLLDEPTDGLDPMVRRNALVLLTEHLADAPTTVLISTHHIHELESLADHVGVLRGGRLVAQMPREDLQRTVRSYQLEVPDGWEPPRELLPTRLRRSSAGRDVQCTMVGEERAVTERLTATGARVHNVRTLALEDAALAYLPEDGS